MIKQVVILLSLLFTLHNTLQAGGNQLPVFIETSHHVISDGDIDLSLASEVDNTTTFSNEVSKVTKHKYRTRIWHKVLEFTLPDIAEVNTSYYFPDQLKSIFYIPFLYNGLHDYFSLRGPPVFS